MNARIAALEAETPEFLRPYTSPESYIDAAIAQLIQKGWYNLTDAEKQEYLDLLDERVARMIPEAVHRFRRLRDSRSGGHSWASTNKFRRWFQNGWQALTSFLKRSKTRLIGWWRREPDM